MPLITENSSISGYIESLFSKHLENASDISYVSGNSPIAGYFSNASSSSDNPTGVSARFLLDTYNDANTFGSSFRGRRYRGTFASPSGVLKDDVLLQLVGDGYNPSSGKLVTAKVSLALFAAENWTGDSNGTYAAFRTTPTGTAIVAERLRIDPDGNVGINNFNPQYKLDVSGSGNFIAAYQGGVPLSTVPFVTGISGAITAQINVGTVLSVEGLAGIIDLIPAGNISLTTNLIGNSITISGNEASSLLFNTGSTLDAKINSLSGNNYSSFKVTGSTAISAPNFSGIGTTQVFRSGNFVLISGQSAAAGAGEANTVSNLSNSGLFSQKVGVDLQFKGLKAGAGISITGDTNQLTVSSTASSSLSINQTEIDFGPTGVSDATFTIIDSNITVNSKIIGQVAWVAPTDKDIDEIECDKLEIKCQPSGGGFLMFVESQDGSYLHDKFKINYLLG